VGIKKRFGISPQEYQDRLSIQNNLCALCGEEFSGKAASGRAPALDHDHNTGQLRQFIHGDCNRAIGLLKDSPLLLRKAAEYIERHV
jgi:Recombination endonuclease VII